MLFFVPVLDIFLFHVMRDWAEEGAASGGVEDDFEMLRGLRVHVVHLQCSDILWLASRSSRRLVKVGRMEEEIVRVAQVREVKNFPLYFFVFFQDSVWRR